MTSRAPEDVLLANGLLAGLQPEARDRLARLLHRVTYESGELVYAPNGPTTQVYFPTTAVFSLVMEMEEGETVEAMVAGNDGVLGGWVAANIHRAPWRSLAQIPGEALALDVAAFRAELDMNQLLRERVLRYMVAQHYLTAQSVGCNRFHPLKARAARWILVMRDNVQGDVLQLTQDFVSHMLGVHRPSVTVILGELEEARLIARVRRGRIEILDGAALEAIACECYASVRRFFAANVAADVSPLAR